MRRFQNEKAKQWENRPSRNRDSYRKQLSSNSDGIEDDERLRSPTKAKSEEEAMKNPSGVWNSKKQAGKVSENKTPKQLSSDSNNKKKGLEVAAVPKVAAAAAPETAATEEMGGSAGTQSTGSDKTETTQDTVEQDGTANEMKLPIRYQGPKAEGLEADVQKAEEALEADVRKADEREVDVRKAVEEPENPVEPEETKPLPPTPTKLKLTIPDAKPKVSPSAAEKPKPVTFKFKFISPQTSEDNGAGKTPSPVTPLTPIKATIDIKHVEQPVVPKKAAVKDDKKKGEDVPPSAATVPLILRVCNIL